MVSKRRVKVAAATIVAVLAAVGIAFSVAYRVYAPTESEVAFARDMVSIDSAIDQVTDSFTDGDGYVAPENERQAVEAVRAYADENPDGTIASYADDGDSITLVLANGVHYVYAPAVQGELGGAGDVTSIAAYEPYASVFKDGEQATGLSAQADKIASERGISSAESYSSDGAVSVDALKTAFGQNQIVLWYGHACTTSTDGTILGTGTTPGDAIDANYEGNPIKRHATRFNWKFTRMGGKTSEEDYQDYTKWMAANAAYADDFEQGRLVVFARSDMDDRIGVTSKFFSANYSEGALADSSFYFGSCQVMRDTDSLAKILTDLGAQNVAGFTDTVSVDYESNVRAALTNALASKDSSFGDAACAVSASCDAEDPQNAGTRFLLVSADGQTQQAWDAAVRAKADAADAANKSSAEKGSEEGSATATAQTESAQAEEPVAPGASSASAEGPAPDAEGSIVEAWRKQQAGYPTWYYGDATFLPGGEMPYTSFKASSYISDAYLDGDTLVVKGVLRSAMSEDELYTYTGVSATGDEQTYRFRLTDSTVVTRGSQTWDAGQFESNFGDGRTLAPAWTFCADSDGSLISLDLHS